MSELTIRMTNDDDQVSKSNQIDMLEELQKFFEGHDLYLSSFFRIELVDWAIQAIENDIAPDIWADRVFRISEHYEVAQKLHNLRAANEKLEDEIKTCDDNTDQILINKDERIRGLGDQLERYQDLIDGYRANVDALNEQLQRHRQTLVNSNLRISTHQQEILELKALLWDAVVRDLPE